MEKKKLVLKHPIEWKPVVDFPNYMVSNWGEIKSLYTGIILKHWLNPAGYHNVHLYADSKHGSPKIVARLVATAFVYNNDPVKKTQVDHIDHDKDNNCEWNLQWIGSLDNTRRRLSCKSPHQYITWHKKGAKWMVQMSIEEKVEYFGLFAELDDAINCVNETIDKMNLYNTHRKIDINIFN